MHPLKLSHDSFETEPLKIRLVKFKYDRPQVPEARPEPIGPIPDLARRQSRMRIGVEAGQFIATGNMDLLHTIGIELFEIVERRQNSVLVADIKVMQIEQRAAVELRIEAIQKLRLAHLGVWDGRENRSIFQDDIATERALENVELALNDQECFF